MADSMRAAGVDPAMVYAYQRTHLMITEQHRETPLAFAADLDEWDDAVAEYRRFGFDGCLTKPYRLEELRQALDALFRPA